MSRVSVGDEESREGNEKSRDSARLGKGIDNFDEALLKEILRSQRVIKIVMQLARAAQCTGTRLPQVSPYSPVILTTGNPKPVNSMGRNLHGAI